MTASKKGMSAHQTHRMLHVIYKTAWFMCHRIREAMRDIAPATGRSGPANKREIVGLVERGGEGGMMHMARITGKNLREYVVRNASRKSRPHTDESRICTANLSNFRTTRRFCVTRQLPRAATTAGAQCGRNERIASAMRC